MKPRLLLFLTVSFLFAQSSSIPPAYNQLFRPQFHFSPREHWTNDPNGLVYFEGEYHLFFQYNPFGDEWGHMSWGHAVSRDLVHWEQLRVALPEQDGIMIFTGSTVVDEHNSSGFCRAAKPCMVAIYTGHTGAAGDRPALQTQNLAYSNDNGRTWTKYSGNPVLNLNMTDFRDPKVFWSRLTNRWTMVVSLPNEHKVRIYGSSDLKHWEALSDFGPAGATGGQWECPELFELPIEGGGRDALGPEDRIESWSAAGWIRRAVLYWTFRRQAIHKRQSVFADDVDRLREGLLLRAHFQQSAPG